MAKFHINKRGVPAPCKAQPGNCPLGGDEQHFSSQEKAQEFADTQNEKQFELIPDVSKENKKESPEKKLTPAQQKRKEKKEFESKVANKLGSYWTKKDGSPDEKMINYLVKSNKYVEIENSLVDTGDSKPRIYNEILYDDETEAPEVNFENFYNYNVRMGMPDYYKKEGRFTGGNDKLKIVPLYGGDNLELAGLTYDDNPKGEYREVSEDELKEINEGIKEVREDYKKRLESYYKRYKDKIWAKGYWKNR